MSLPLNQVIQGNCINVLKTFPENSIDEIVTDPPYGLNFMGKAWDKALPPKQAFIEMCRVLKPGALAFVMSSPRQDLMWRMAQLLEESGFDLGQSFISWVYASGFPKAMDVSLGIDIKIIREDFEKTNNRKPTREEMKKLLQDKREVVGKGNGTSWNYQNKINVEQDFRPNDYYEDKDGDFNITAPSSNEAKQWQGWKAVSGLKPALEVIFMVQKPLSEKTIVDNVLKWGTGAMNVDGCRIPYKQDEEIQTTWKGASNTGETDYGKYDKGDGFESGASEKGRFPANLLVSDDVLNDGKITKSNGHFNSKVNMKGHTLYEGGFGDFEQEDRKLMDIGSNSRYFDLDAWAQHHGILKVPKASTSERDVGLENEENQIPKSKFNLNNGSLDERFDGGKITPRANIHPTVKPIKLMAYLVELGCPYKGIVLDPFVGSGTTCIAAKQLSRNYIGIELSPEYAEMARKRIESFYDNPDMFFV